MDASASAYTSGAFTYEWDCTPGDSTQYCVSCVDIEASVAYYGGDRSVAYFPPAALQPGEYTIGVTVKDPSGFSDYTSVHVTVLRESVPDVYGDPIPLSNVISDNKLFLRYFSPK